MKLPVPYRVDRTIVEAESSRLKGGVLADARKAAEEGNPWNAMHVLASGGVSALVDENGGTEEDRGQIKTFLLESPYVNVEYLSLMAMATIGADDPVDMICRCPSCKKKWNELSPRLSELEVKYSETPDEGGRMIPVVPEVTIELEYPVEIVVKNRETREEKTLLSVSSLTFEYPRLRTVIAAQKRVGLTDTTRLQYFAWAQSILQVDGEAVEDKWKLQWWDKLFERMDSADIRKISHALTEFGLENKIEMTCSACGKVFNQVVPTQDFFESGLLESR